MGLWEQENAEDVKRNRKEVQELCCLGEEERDFGFGCVRLNETLAG